MSSSQCYGIAHDNRVEGGVLDVLLFTYLVLCFDIKAYT